MTKNETALLWGRLRVWVARLGLLGAVCMAGCASEEPGGIVFGTVTYKGKMLGKGTVAFHPAGSGGQLCHGLIQNDGTFKLQNQTQGERIPPGKYVATVMVDNASVAAMKEDPSMKLEQTVPIKFESVTATPLKYEVAVGENKFDINLDNYQ